MCSCWPPLGLWLRSTATELRWVAVDAGIDAPSILGGMGQMGRDILDDISKETFWYSVAFVKVKEQGGDEIPCLQGSGVLVQYRTFYGILTAAHVAAELAKLDFIGMVYSEEPTQIGYKKDVFRIDTIMYKKGDIHGPDLALVTPPIKLLNELKAKKSFVNLIKGPEPLDFALGGSLTSVWSIMGAVQELSANEGPERNLRAMLMSYSCAEPFFQTHNDYDLFELRAEISKNTDTPGSFGGVSGGGLWRIVLELQGGEAKIRQHPKLMGIAFYQGDIVNDARIIRGHGPSSAYDMVRSFLSRWRI